MLAGVAFVAVGAANTLPAPLAALVDQLLSRDRVARAATLGHASRILADHASAEG